MPAGARSALTLTVLALLLAAGAAWGWSALTEPLPARTDATGCVETAIGTGDEVYPSQVTVSVLNAGTREGLAGRTMSLFEEEDFVAGDSGNAPDDAEVAAAQIWTDEPGSPAVRLVKSWLPEGTEVQRRDTTESGVVVVVGDEFQALRPGRTQVVARKDSRICSPAT